MKYLLSATVLFFLAGAFGIYGQTVLKDPSWVYKERGDRYYRNNNLGNAFAEYEKALEKKQQESPGKAYPEVNLMLAKIYYHEGLYHLALNHLNKAENNQHLFRIPDLIYEVLYTKADVLKSMESYHQLLILYQRIIDRDTNWQYFSNQSIYELPDRFMDNQELRQKYGRSYLELGIMKYNNNNFENSIPYLMVSLRYKYRINESLKYLKNCYTKLGSKSMVEEVNNISKNL